MDQAVANIESVMTEIDVFNATLTSSKEFIANYSQSLNSIGPIDSLAQEAINISQFDVAYLDGEGRSV